MKKLRQAEERTSTPIIPETRFSDFLPLEKLELSKNVVTSEKPFYVLREQIHSSDWAKDVFHPPNS